MFLDTNVLVQARFEAAPGHALARHRMREAGESGGEALRISRRVLRESPATVTRPQSWSPPTAMNAALGHVAALQEVFEILEDGPGVTVVLRRLCRVGPVAGRRIHGANLVATMLARGEGRLPTFNASDFRRYGERLELIGLGMAL